MKKVLSTVLLLFTALSINLNSQALSGDKIIKAVGGDFPNLEAAIASLNNLGASGTVRFLIDEDLTETAANLVINRPDLSASNNLIIKPNTGKTPKISLLGFAASSITGTQQDTARRQAGITILNTGYVTIDGSNGAGTTRDLTISSLDPTNGINLINLFGNSDNITIKNTIIKWDSINAGHASTRGIYANGQWSGVVDNILVENCQIGDGALDPYYAVGFTGHSGTSQYATQISVKKSTLYGRMRPVYFYIVGTPSTVTEVSDCEIHNVNPPATGNVVWGTLLNTYDGTFNFFRNKLNSLRSVSAATNGVYGFGTLNGKTTSLVQLFNNFFGGDIQHTGTGIPASVDVISFQDNVIAKVYNNTIVLNEFPNKANTRMTCIRLGGTGNLELKNNIIYTLKNNPNVYGIRYDGGTLVSNNNVFYNVGDSANVGYWTTAQQTLAAWQTASTQDAASNYKNVTFTGVFDLHLAGDSQTDIDLYCPPLPEITVDIDGDPRHPTNPFKGADEGLHPVAPLSGTYYVGAAGTGPGGSNPQFSSFKQVVDTLSKGTIGGDVTIYITSDLTETYADVQGIGLAVNPEPYNIVFKPYTGVQPVITFNYPTDLNSGPSGAFVIGMPSAGNVAWDSMRTTKNITFDGSNTAEGTTRDLTFQCATTAHRNAMPIVITGNSSFITFKNCKIYYKAQGVSTSGNLFIGAIMVRSRNYLGVNWVPSELTFENCHISSNFDGVFQNAQGYGTYQTGTPAPLDFPYNITLKNNIIEGKRRAISLYVAGDHDIFGNQILLNQNIAANISNEAVYAVNVDTGSVVNIYNNKIVGVGGISTGAAATLNAISIESFGTYNVYNNMINGFSLTAANPTVVVNGIKNTSASATLNLYFNSLYMDNLPAAGTGAITYNGLLLTNGTNDVKNNVVLNDEADFVSYCINRTGTNGTLTSDYNDFFASDGTNGHVGFFDAAPTKSLIDWKAASGQDAHSQSYPPFFASNFDLHITESSIALIGKGVTIPGFVSDIDGDLRDLPPDIGADEIPGLIPVELTSFKAEVNGSSVQLTWQTATETNSAYFEVERKSELTSWTAVGRVNAAGNTTSAVNYSFTDESVKETKATYRLKQVDFDGSFAYSKEIEVDIDVPTVYELSQNYPNPFNPSTTIKYALPEEGKVTLEIYTMLGELVRTLVNDVQPAGRYTVTLDGSKLSSGTYIYRLVAGKNVMTKKMVLIK